MINNSQVEKARIKKLNDKPPLKGDYVLYWMQQSQRKDWNHALEYAIHRANELNLPLAVGFGLMPNYPDAYYRHYRFMLEGLRETQQNLAMQGIKMIVQLGSPPQVALRLGEKAAAIICDRGYLRHQKEWRLIVASMARCAVYEVESDVITPVEVASNKAETSARTIRPKLYKHLAEYLEELHPSAVKHPSNLSGFVFDNIDLSGTDLEEVLSNIKSTKGDEVPFVPFFKGGTSEAISIFNRFLVEKLDGYQKQRNQPQTDYVSFMGMYLHFGQISPLYLLWRIEQMPPSEDRDSFREELLVRRELAQNFVNFTPDYDCFSSIPRWAQQTLAEHQNDIRPYLYTVNQLDEAATHDIYWNAAMRELKYTGYMHNYMRMYWGKKILEWSPSPEEAYKTLLYLNDRYFFDGRDPNSYANIGWIFGLHDRPWPEREIFGKIRYMSAGGLERKSDPGSYIKKIDTMLSVFRA